MQPVLSPKDEAVMNLAKVKDALEQGYISPIDIEVALGEVLANINAQRTATADQAKAVATPDQAKSAATPLSLPTVHTGETPQPRIITDWHVLRDIFMEHERPNNWEKAYTGPEFLKETRGIEIPEARLPKLSISEIRAQNAAKAGCVLSLHSDTLGNGKPSTMLNQDEEFQARLQRHLYANRFFSGLRIENEPFANDIDKLAWRMSTRLQGTRMGGGLSDDKERYYLDAIIGNVTFFKKNIIQNDQLSVLEQEAIDEFEGSVEELKRMNNAVRMARENYQSMSLEDLVKSPGHLGRIDLGRILPNLKIMQLIFPAPVEFLNDIYNAMLRSTYYRGEDCYRCTTGRIGQDNSSSIVIGGSEYSYGVHIKQIGISGPGIAAYFSQSLTPKEGL